MNGIGFGVIVFEDLFLGIYFLRFISWGLFLENDVSVNICDVD